MKYKLPRKLKKKLHGTRGRRTSVLRALLDDEKLVKRIVKSFNPIEFPLLEMIPPRTKDENEAIYKWNMMRENSIITNK